MGGHLWRSLRRQKQRRKRYAGGRDRRGQIPDRRSITERPESIFSWASFCPLINSITHPSVRPDLSSLHNTGIPSRIYICLFTVLDSDLG
jgi:hypothetical protein